MRLRVTNIIQHTRCPYCRDEVRPEGTGDDAARGCSSCLAWSHVVTSFCPTGTSKDQSTSSLRVSISETVLGCQGVLT